MCFKRVANLLSCADRERYITHDKLNKDIWMLKVLQSSELTNKYRTLQLQHQREHLETLKFHTGAYIRFVVATCYLDNKVCRRN